MNKVFSIFLMMAIKIMAYSQPGEGEPLKVFIYDILPAKKYVNWKRENNAQVPILENKSRNNFFYLTFLKNDSYKNSAIDAEGRPEGWSFPSKNYRPKITNRGRVTFIQFDWQNHSYPLPKTLYRVIDKYGD